MTELAALAHSIVFEMPASGTPWWVTALSTVIGAVVGALGAFAGAAHLEARRAGREEAIETKRNERADAGEDRLNLGALRAWRNDLWDAQDRLADGVAKGGWWNSRFDRAADLTAPEDRKRVAILLSWDDWGTLASVQRRVDRSRRPAPGPRATFPPSFIGTAAAAELFIACGNARKVLAAAESKITGERTSNNEGEHPRREMVARKLNELTGA